MIATLEAGRDAATRNDWAAAVAALSAQLKGVKEPVELRSVEWRAVAG